MFQGLSESRYLELMGENIINVEEFNKKFVATIIQTAEDRILKNCDF